MTFYLNHRQKGFQERGNGMLETEFYLPEDLPNEFLLYEQKVKQLGVGRTGKTGAICMTLKREVDRDKTVATELFSKVPLQVQKVLYVEESLPQMAYVYLMSPSGGIVQGDRLRIDITMEKDALAHVTTQAATKIYRMNRNYATQMVNVHVDDNCYFELIPDQLIPYRDARFYQRVKMQIHDNATVIYSEIIAPGRVARDEYFQYDICYFKTIATDHTSRLRFMDTFMLEPKRQNLLGFGLRQKSLFANLYIVTKKIDADTLGDSIHKIMVENSVNGSASVLPRHDGVSARIIADTVGEINNAIDIVLNKIRGDILGNRFTGARKY